MSKVDISPEAVERLAACIGKTCACALGPNAEQPVAATLRAQAELIAELEAENAILRTEKHADAEAIAAMKDAGMDRLVAEGQKCDAMTPQEAAKMLEDNFDTVWTKAIAIEAENARETASRGKHKWPVICREGVRAALRAISEDSQ